MIPKNNETNFKKTSHRLRFDIAACHYAQSNRDCRVIFIFAIRNNGLGGKKFCGNNTIPAC